MTLKEKYWVNILSLRHQDIASLPPLNHYERHYATSRRATPGQHLVGHWCLPDLLVLLLHHDVDATQQLAHAGGEHLQVGVKVVVAVVEVVVGFL